jgi:hypothetical protein
LVVDMDLRFSALPGTSSSCGTRMQASGSE